MRIEYSLLLKRKDYTLSLRKLSPIPQWDVGMGLLFKEITCFLWEKKFSAKVGIISDKCTGPKLASLCKMTAQLYSVPIHFDSHLNCENLLNFIV